ncbi:MAG: hypothetical protein ABJZ55_15755 [Fuerstiella sp.]
MILQILDSSFFVSPAHGRVRSSTGTHRLIMRTLVVAVLFASSGAIAMATDEARQTEFQLLERKFQQAQTQSDFIEVATAYESLKGPATSSASVLFNQANAWLKAEEFGRAIAGYRQAIKLQPADTGIRSNLKLAFRKANHAMPQSRILDYAFFWNHWFTRSTLAMLITLLVVAAAVLFVFNRSSPLCRTGFRILAALAVVLIASFVLKVKDENFTVHGVVIADSSDAKKGPAASYESAYSNALTDGQELTVIDQQQDWLHVEVSGIGSGWLPKSDVVLYSSF